MKKEFIFDLLEDELDPIDEGTIIAETGADHRNIRKLYMSKLHPAAKKVTPVRRRFMFGLAAALITAATIATAAAVTAQTNGNTIEAVIEDNAQEGHYNPSTGEIKRIKEEINNEVKENAEALFYKKNGYSIRDVDESNWKPSISSDYARQELYYRNKLYTELLTKLINDGYGEPSLIPEQPENDYWVEGDNEWYWADNIDLYCDRITVFCNAYNDLAYTLSEKERVFIFDTLESDYSNLYDYVQMNNNYTDKLLKTYELIENTIVPETGYKKISLPD